MRDSEKYSYEIGGTVPTVEDYVEECSFIQDGAS